MCIADNFRLRKVSRRGIFIHYSRTYIERHCGGLQDLWAASQSWSSTPHRRPIRAGPRPRGRHRCALCPKAWCSSCCSRWRRRHGRGCLVTMAYADVVLLLEGIVDEFTPALDHGCVEPVWWWWRLSTWTDPLTWCSVELLCELPWVQDLPQ